MVNAVKVIITGGVLVKVSNRMSKNVYPKAIKQVIRGRLIPEGELTSLNKWYPVEVTEENGVLSTRWYFFGDLLFNQPFFYQSITEVPFENRRICDLPFNSAKQLSKFDFIEPSAFIFHCSRCGSTLITQLLSLLSQCIVFSEPQVIDILLHLACFGQDKTKYGETLKTIMHAFGQKRSGKERYLFVKLDCWHICHFQFIRSFFPDTPCFFLYRPPFEVLRSHRRQRGAHMVPGILAPEIVGLNPADQRNFTDLDSYGINVLTSYFKAALGHNDLILMNYNQLPNVIWEKFADFFSISFTKEEMERMKSRSSLHSKHSHERFVEKTDQGGELPADMQVLNTLYNRLEHKRLNP